MPGQIAPQASHAVRWRPFKRKDALQGPRRLHNRGSCAPQAIGNRLVTERGYRLVNDQCEDRAMAKRNDIDAAQAARRSRRKQRARSKANCRMLNRRRFRRAHSRSSRSWRRPAIEPIATPAPATAKISRFTLSARHKRNALLAASVAIAAALGAARRRGRRGGERRLCRARAHRRRRPGRAQGDAAIDRPARQGNHHAEGERAGGQQSPRIRSRSPRTPNASIRRPSPTSRVRSRRRRIPRRFLRRCRPRVRRSVLPRWRRRRPPVRRWCRAGRSATPATVSFTCKATATSIRSCPARRCRVLGRWNRSSGRTAAGW